MSAVQKPKPRSAIAESYIALLRKFNHAITGESRVSRIVRRPIWNVFYNSASRNLPKGPTTFMNWGYLADESELQGEDRADIADRVSRCLYEQVLADVDVRGRSVVEVGCGAGAGSAHLARTYHPGSLVGIDLSKRLIALCEKRHDIANLRFLRGDALDLPIPSDSVDVVVNVESSHCYPSRLQFFEEVMRVLRPGGSFVLADGMLCDESRDDVGAVNRQLGQAGLAVADCVDMTANVLAARDAVSRSCAFRARLSESTPALMMRVAEESLCLAGTKMYEDLVAGRLRYLRWKATRPAG